MFRFTCPRCTYADEDEDVTCPRCNTTYHANDLATLSHVDYVVTQVVGWRRAGLLSAKATEAVIKQVREDRQAALDRLVGRSDDEPSSSAAALIAPLSSEAPSTTAATEQMTEAPRRRPARPRFSWNRLGAQLLSERTLNALLGLGAFLILAAGVVISTLNPTGLSPGSHLLATLLTTLVLYVSGYVARHKLNLPVAGSALLGIAAAFVPLVVWSVGHDTPLHWNTGTVWLIASSLCLPVYLGSHAVLRDRTFAVLASLAAGSELLALERSVGVPPAWSAVSLVALALGYIFLSVRLPRRWNSMASALAWTARTGVPVVMLGLVAGRFHPIGDITGTGGSYDYAVGAAWWLGAVFFVVAAWAYRQRRYEYAAAWTVAFAHLFTLTKTPFGPAWYGVGLALLAGVFFAFEWWDETLSGRRHVPLPRYLLNRPAYGTAVALSVAAAVWPLARPVSVAVALVTLVVIYAMAALAFDERIWAYVAVFTLPFACAFGLVSLGMRPVFQAPVWALLAVLLLLLGEQGLRRTGESRRSLEEIVTGSGAWKSLFGPACCVTGYAVGLYAAWSSLDAWAGAIPLASPGGTTWAEASLATIVVLAFVSASTRRSSIFLYPATILTPVCLLMVWTAVVPGWTLEGFGIVFTAVAALYLTVGFLIFSNAGAGWRRPWYIAGYAAAVLGAVLSAPSPKIAVVALALDAGLFVASAILSGRPAWLYAATASGLASYLAGTSVIWAGASIEALLTSFVVPAGALAWLGHGLARHRDHVEPWRDRWAQPLLAGSATAIVIATTASAGTPASGFAIGCSLFALVGTLAVLWRAEWVVWASTALLAFVLQEGVRLLGIPIVDQPVAWVVAALIVGTPVALFDRLNDRSLHLWSRPLRLTSLGTTVVAPIVAASLAGVPGGHAIPNVALTTAIAGVSLLTQGLLRQERLLNYLGVAALDCAFMIQLTVLHVGEIQAYVVPSGACLLGIAYLEWRRGTPGPIKAALESTSLAVLLVPSLLQTAGLAGTGVGNVATYLLLESVAVFALGVTLHWKRTFFSGAAAMVTNVVILLASPLRAMNTWYLVALIGFIMIGLVLLIEQRRRQIPVWVDQWRKSLESWA